ncbi:MAG: DUF3426 domain-containing protein [Lysobacter sp.]|nr:MAG: DUF3426 domain-containing protein [Lysobacter sp.]
MFINCPYCRALVATDVATDLPPPRCPHCKGPLREDAPAAADATSGDAQEAMPEDALDLESTRIAANGFAHDGADDDDGASATTSDNDSTLPVAHPEAERSEVAHDADAATDEDASPSASTADERIDERIDTQNEDSVARDDAVVASPAPMAAPRTTRRRAGQVAPSFARVATRDDASAPRSRRWPALLAIAALCIVLALQILLADRARLASNAHWRPLLEALCGALSCDLPPWREPEAFALLQRDVRQHPTVRGALRITASFRNDARWPQPWPKLHVTLSDVNGRPAGERSFEVREYLGGPPAQAMLGSGETATVAMDVLEPAAQTVAYDMRFR